MACAISGSKHHRMNKKKIHYLLFRPRNSCAIYEATQIGGNIDFLFIFERDQFVDIIVNGLCSISTFIKYCTLLAPYE